MAASASASGVAAVATISDSLPPPADQTTSQAAQASAVAGPSNAAATALYGVTVAARIAATSKHTRQQQLRQRWPLPAQLHGANASLSFMQPAVQLQLTFTHLPSTSLAARPACSMVTGRSHYCSSCDAVRARPHCLLHAMAFQRPPSVQLAAKQFAPAPPAAPTSLHTSWQHRR